MVFMIRLSITIAVMAFVFLYNTADKDTEAIYDHHLSIVGSLAMDIGKTLLTSATHGLLIIWSGILAIDFAANPAMPSLADLHAAFMDQVEPYVIQGKRILGQIEFCKNFLTLTLGEDTAKSIILVLIVMSVGALYALHLMISALANGLLGLIATIVTILWAIVSWPVWVLFVIVRALRLI